MSLEVYYDLFSQPSRAVVLFCKVNGIPFIPKPVTLKKCEYFYFNTFFHHDPCRDICSPPYVGEPIPVSIGCQSWVVCQVVTLTTSSIYNVWSDIWHFCSDILYWHRDWRLITDTRVWHLELTLLFWQLLLTLSPDDCLLTCCLTVIAYIVVWQFELIFVVGYFALTLWSDVCLLMLLPDF